MKDTVVITGASGGIGSAIAKKLAKEGCELLLCGSSSPEKLEKLKKECLKYNDKCVTFCGDISRSDTAVKIVETALEHFKKIDALINNAGISKIGLLPDLSDDEWFHILNTNLSSAFFLCRQVLPHMIHAKKGRILNISSIWGNTGASCEAAYSATKGGLNSLTKSLAKELAPSGISVNAIACGMIDTSMNACFTPQEIHAICEEIPAGRMASPEETAEFIALLLKAPEYLTGQVIGFDGGW